MEVRLRLKVPLAFAWRQFMVDHPELTAVTSNRHVEGSQTVVLEVSIRGGEGRDWSRELRVVPTIVSVRELSHIGRPNVYRIKWKAPPFYVELIDRFDLIGALPFVIAQESATVSLALTRSRLRKLIREMHRRGFFPEIVELRPLRGSSEPGGLTAKQRERFQLAVEAGFYDVPRRVSLDELARRFSVRKSAFAESLALARRKILIAAGRVLTSGDESARSILLGMP